jgi:uncharacterized membrane protein YccC
MTIEKHIKTYRVKYALKATLACLICILINEYWHLDYGFFSVISAFVLLSMFYDNTVSKGIQRFIGILLGAILAVLIVNLFYDVKPIYLFIMLSWIGLCTYLYADQRFPYPYAALMSGIFSGVIMLHGAESYSEVESLASSLVIQVAIGVFIATLVYRFLWPVNYKTHLRDALSAVFEDFGNMFLSIKSKTLESQASKIPSIRLSFDTFSHLLDFAKKGFQEQKDVIFPEHSYIRFVGHCKNLFIDTQEFESNLKSQNSILSVDEGIKIHLNEILDILSSYSQIIGRTILQNQNNRLTPISDQLIRNIASIEKRLQSSRTDEDVTQRLSQEKLFAAGATLLLLRDIFSDFKNVTKAYNKIQEGGSVDRVTTTPQILEKKVKETFHISIQSLKHSVKVVIISILILLGSIFYYIDAGIQTLITALLISAQANLGQATLKERLRFVAVVIGGFYGLICLIIISIFPNFLVFLLLFTLGLFVGSYIATGSERVSYAGVQTGIVLPMILLISNGPSTGSLQIAVERFVGVIVGGAIALIILRFIWPDDPLKQLKVKIARSFILCGKIFSILIIPQFKEEQVKPLISDLAMSLPTSESLLKDAQYVIRLENAHTKELLEVIESLEHIYFEFETLNKTIYADIDNKMVNSYLNNMGPFYSRVSQNFIQLGEKLKLGMKFEFQLNDLALLNKGINEERGKFHISEAWRELKNDDIERIGLIDISIDNILKSLEKISFEINKAKGEIHTVKPVEAT